MLHPTLVSGLATLEAVLAYIVTLSATDEESTVFSGFGCAIVLVAVACLACEEKINAKISDVMAQEEE